MIIPHQPNSAAERCDLARRFAHNFDMSTSCLDQDSTNIKNVVEILVDDPEEGDPFEQQYAPWPLRLYLIDPHGKIEWIAQPKDCSYDRAVEELLEMLGLTVC